MKLSRPARAILQRVATTPERYRYEPGFRWRNYLSKLGLIEQREGRGFRVTARGREALAS